MYYCVVECEAIYLRKTMAVEFLGLSWDIGRP